VKAASAIVLTCALACVPLCARSAQLPQAPAPRPPFPAIVTDASTVSFVAPGVTYGDYEMLTSQGPLPVHGSLADLHDPNVRVDAVRASDRIISSGATVSAMAARTGAVAGVNGDYFDIGNTNQPLNVLVQNGRLLHGPMRRYALVLTNDRRAQFVELSLKGSLELASGETVALDQINAWPPAKNGATLITPEFGPVPPQRDGTLVKITPVFGTPPFATFRAIGVLDTNAAAPAAYYLGIGADASQTITVPVPGDTIVTQAQSDPPLAQIATAVGGGPLLLRGGRPYEDADGPGGTEFTQRIPATGAALTAEGALLLIEVDGRQPNVSVGLTRPQFAMLMSAFGGRDGMAFDGGGSSAIVARRPGAVYYTQLTLPTGCSGQTASRPC